MESTEVAAVAEKWGLSLPPEMVEAFQKLSTNDEIGVWKLNSGLLDPSNLPTPGPIDLFPIGEDGMEGYLCLYPDRFAESDSIPMVMWTPASRQITFLGENFHDFLERETHRRLDFLLERGTSLSEEQVTLARKGETVSVEGLPEESQTIAALLADACRVAGILGLSESIFDRASGKSSSPDFLREVDGRDEPGIEQAIGELKEMAMKGDAAAAFEVLGFLQIRQKAEDVAKWAYLAAKCSLYTWPDFSVRMLTKLAELLKANAAAIPAVERLDPLFGFMTTQPPTKVDGRLNLAKQYMRKKDYRSAVREAENSILLSYGWSDSQAVNGGLRNGYQLLVEIFRAANRPRELAYAELMLAKVPS
ncbi:SMI1/KNR4 family protein [bacterium]|nr:SMI1/KNR4 family protein [bacterium]